MPHKELSRCGSTSYPSQPQEAGLPGGNCDVAIYRQKHRAGTAVRFEAIVVQHLEERPMPKGYVREAGEYYPQSSQWGKAGWTFYTLDEAHAYATTLHGEGVGPQASPV